MKENIRLPKSALTLYVKLYCKKKENMHTKYKMLKATGSWLSLTETEKQQFMDKLKELQNSYKKTFANYLKHAEMFMKKKSPKHITNTVTRTLDSTTENQTIHSPDIEDVPSQPTGQLPSDIHIDYQNATNEIQEVFYPKLAEPMPPNIRNAKELFELIHKKEGNNKNWNSLSASEKRRYQNAVLFLKKEFIKRYREYLECLSSEELFCHYNKVI